MGARRQRVRSVLIVCQVAFSFVLLIGAGLMLRSLTRLQEVDPGFVSQRVLAMNIDLNWSKYKNDGQLRAVSERMLTQSKALPGVLSAAIASNFPLEHTDDPSMSTLEIEGRVAKPGETLPLTSLRSTTPGYFKTLGIPLLRELECSQIMTMSVRFLSYSSTKRLQIITGMDQMR